jgi:hypothetical protein
MAFGEAGESPQWRDFVVTAGVGAAVVPTVGLNVPMVCRPLMMPVAPFSVGEAGAPRNMEPVVGHKASAAFVAAVRLVVSHWVSWLL